MTQPQPSTRLDEEAQKIYQQALELYWRDPDWVTFFREILGSRGVVRKQFRDKDELSLFERTPEYTEIKLMLARLRHKGSRRRGRPEPTRVITVRMPKSLHEALQSEAFLHQTSMNKLCITKLLQFIDGQIVDEIATAPSDIEEPEPEPEDTE